MGNHSQSQTWRQYFPINPENNFFHNTDSIFVIKIVFFPEKTFTFCMFFVEIKVEQLLDFQSVVCNYFLFWKDFLSIWSPYWSMPSCYVLRFGLWFYSYISLMPSLSCISLAKPFSVSDSGFNFLSHKMLIMMNCFQDVAV